MQKDLWLKYDAVCNHEKRCQIGLGDDSLRSDVVFLLRDTNRSSHLITSRNKKNL